MQEQPIRILLVEGAPAFARQLGEMLSGSKGVGFEIIQTDYLGDGLRRLAHGGIDIVLLDLSLLEGGWLESFEQIRTEAPHVPVILLSTLDDETVAVKAVHEGAQ